MVGARKPPEPRGRRALLHINFPAMANPPQTTTLLALGFLVGCLLFTPMIAVVGRFIQPDFRDAVMTMAGLFKDGMLLILGYYFAKVVNTGQEDLAKRALEAAATTKE